MWMIEKIYRMCPVRERMLEGQNAAHAAVRKQITNKIGQPQ